MGKNQHSGEKVDWARKPRGIADWPVLGFNQVATIGKDPRMPGLFFYGAKNQVVPPV